MSKTVKKPSRLQATPVAETIRVEFPPQLTAVLAGTRSAFFCDGRSNPGLHRPSACEVAAKRFHYEATAGSSSFDDSPDAILCRVNVAASTNRTF